MGALGCSEGPVPSSVVCALAVRRNAPPRISATIPKPTRNLLFMTHLKFKTPNLCFLENVHLRKGKYRAITGAREHKITSLFSLRRVKRRFGQYGVLAVLGQGWWFSATWT